MKQAILLIYLSTLLLTAPHSALANSPPPTGKYIFTIQFSLNGCAKHAESRGIYNPCVRHESKSFNVGDSIDVSEFFWDDKTKTWGAKYVFLGQNRSIPITHLSNDPEVNVCKTKIDEYKNVLKETSRKCKKDSDCVLHTAVWNSCEWPIPAQENPKARKLLAEIVTMIPKTKCPILHPPCAAIPQLTPRCNNGVCERRETMLDRESPRLDQPN